MASPEQRIVRHTELQPLPMPNRLHNYEGTQKTVRKMTDGQHIIAAKIFRDYESYDADEPGDIIDKKHEAEAEFRGYKMLRETPLGIYIPEPYYLLNDENQQVVGLAVEWKDGEVLRYSGQHLRLRDAEIDELENRITRTAELGIYLHSDNINLSNIIIQPDEEQRIVLAEASVDESDDRVSNFARYMPTMLQWLREENAG